MTSDHARKQDIRHFQSELRLSYRDAAVFAAANRDYVAAERLPIDPLHYEASRTSTIPPHAHRHMGYDGPGADAFDLPVVDRTAEGGPSGTMMVWAQSAWYRQRPALLIQPTSHITTTGPRYAPGLWGNFIGIDLTERGWIYDVGDPVGPRGWTAEITPKAGHPSAASHVVIKQAGAGGMVLFDGQVYCSPTWISHARSLMDLWPRAVSLPDGDHLNPGVHVIAPATNLPIEGEDLDDLGDQIDYALSVANSCQAVLPAVIPQFTWRPDPCPFCDSHECRRGACLRS